MVDNKKQGSVNGLAAMFEQNISQVKLEGPVNRPGKKLASNPF